MRLTVDGVDVEVADIATGLERVNRPTQTGGYIRKAGPQGCTATIVLRASSGATVDWTGLLTRGDDHDFSWKDPSGKAWHLQAIVKQVLGGGRSRVVKIAGIVLPG